MTLPSRIICCNSVMLPLPGACGSSAAPLVSRPRFALVSPSAFPAANDESCPAGVAAIAVVATHAAVQTTAPAHRTSPYRHLLLDCMEFPSSLNKAKPNGLSQIDCPDIYWQRSKNRVR